ncbi:uncharacterized protein YukE [Glycomyces artemisiae]|uniref:Uncharacterized protein YukE n=2 Tax=Glycomyces artemisiae TaxID=1076443 RepID=A0A2T0UR73_9ACTN|nr:uncharacterized protein YukE [Glycomyces artemisiae]
MPGFNVDPESMRRSADELDAATTEVQSLLDEFTAAVEQFADAFGGDMIGSLAGVGHQICVDALTETLTLDVEELTGLAAAVREMADDHETVDGEIAASFTTLGKDLGPA